MEVHDELTLELSEKLCEKRCELNSKRLKILSKAFIKFCNQSEKLKKIFKEELDELSELDEQENDYMKTLYTFLT